MADASARKHSAAHWCLQNIAQESVDSSDEEFFDAKGSPVLTFPQVLLCWRSLRLRSDSLPCRQQTQNVR
ncbi:unnamed protein product [Arctogadus glacialis]